MSGICEYKGTAGWLGSMLMVVLVNIVGRVLS